MKALLSLLLFFPLLSFSQKFDVTAMGGSVIQTNGRTNRHQSVTDLTAKYSSGRITCSYYPASFLSIGAYYERNGLQHSFTAAGLTADLHYRFLCFGVNAAAVFLDRIAVSYMPGGDMYIAVPSLARPQTFVIAFPPGIGYGAHLGFCENLSNHFAMKQLLCYSSSEIQGDAIDEHYDITIQCISLFAGISYRL